MSTICSIIVVTLNEAAFIPGLKAAIDRLLLPSDVRIETILVDGGSRDGTLEIARRACFSIIIEHPGASIPACRNRGLARASGEIIAFLDGDCEPAVDWLEQALKALSISQPTIIGWPVLPPPHPTWVQKAWHLHWSHKNTAVVSSAKKEPVLHEAFRLITTRNMLMTRSVLSQLKGFDETLTTGEDTDFVFRAHHQGLNVMGIPTLTVIHHGEPQTLRHFFRQQLWHANRNSYGRIHKISDSGTGANAPRFTYLFIALLAAFILGLLALSSHPAFAFLLIPLPLLLVVPAGVIAYRAHTPAAFFPLAILYGAYGLARTLDLLGLHRDKSTWKNVSLGTGHSS